MMEITIQCLINWNWWRCDLEEMEYEVLADKLILEYVDIFESKVLVPFDGKERLEFAYYSMVNLYKHFPNTFTALPGDKLMAISKLVTSAEQILFPDKVKQSRGPIEQGNGGIIV